MVNVPKCNYFQVKSNLKCPVLTLSEITSDFFLIQCDYEMNLLQIEKYHIRNKQILCNYGLNPFKTNSDN